MGCVWGIFDQAAPRTDMMASLNANAGTDWEKAKTQTEVSMMRFCFIDQSLDVDTLMVWRLLSVF